MVLICRIVHQCSVHVTTPMENYIYIYVSARACTVQTVTEVAATCDVVWFDEKPPATAFISYMADAVHIWLMNEWL